MLELNQMLQRILTVNERLSEETEEEEVEGDG